jgi:hypothetical protein
MGRAWDHLHCVASQFSYLIVLEFLLRGFSGIFTLKRRSAARAMSDPIPANVRSCPKADKICSAANVRFVPIGDIAHLVRNERGRQLRRPS